jgi:hypothetical protein
VQKVLDTTERIACPHSLLRRLCHAAERTLGVKENKNRGHPASFAITALSKYSRETVERAVAAENQRLSTKPISA